MTTDSIPSTAKPTTAYPQPRYVVNPKPSGRRHYSPEQIAGVKLALRDAKKVQVLADGEAQRIAAELGVKLEMVRAVAKGYRGTHIQLIDEEPVDGEAVQ
jgi:hypothetical protein